MIEKNYQLDFISEMILETNQKLINLEETMSKIIKDKESLTNEIIFRIERLEKSSLVGQRLSDSELDFMKSI